MIDSLLRKAIQAKVSEKGIDWIDIKSTCLYSSENRIEAEVMLDGESGALTVEAKYSLEGGSLVIDSIKTSKRWMTELADLILVKTGKKFKLPGGLKGAMVKALL